jgi:peptide/nickel transport system substrate-binding protein
MRDSIRKMMVMACGCSLVCGLLFAQRPPRPGYPVEEEDPRAPRNFKKITVDDEAPTRAPEGAYYVRLAGIDDAIRASSDRRIQAFLSPFRVAHDRLVDVRGRSLRVTPLPLLYPDDRRRFPNPFGVVPLDEKNQPGETLAISVGSVRQHLPMERVVLTEVERWLASAESEAPPLDLRLEVADELLTQTVLFHRSAVDQNRRLGESWKPLREALQARQIAVRLQRLEQAVAMRNWSLVRTLAARTQADRQLWGNRSIQEAVFAARLADAEAEAESNLIPDLERLRMAVTEFDALFPDSRNPVAARVRTTLKERARALFEEAGRLAAQDPNQARLLLRAVEALNPEQPGLREIQRELRAGYSVLVVGVRQLPERMSPATARFDSERLAVELLFEGLTEAIPDLLPGVGETGGLGVRFVPRLAAEPPLAANGWRDVRLVLSANWARAEAGRVDPADVAGTFELLRQIPSNPAADPLEWLDQVITDPAEPARVRLRLRGGPPDWRTLLTTKILPARWLRQSGKRADDPAFAREPFGTGPYRLEPTQRGGGARDLVFVSHSSYGRRPGLAGLPLIKEIHLTDIRQKLDLPGEFRAGRLHILTDVPTADLPKYQANNALGGRVRIVTAQTPRQIHLLAVNHRRPELRSLDLRRGLAAAIDREQILNEVFRAGQKRYHQALRGPFPADCWASPQGIAAGAAPLEDYDFAVAKLKLYRAAGGAERLTLAYSNDDPQVEKACAAIAKAVAATEAGLTLDLKPLPPAELWEVTTRTHAFDLAYLPFDYHDDWYPLRLSRFLDPSAADSGGRNICGYLTPDSLPTQEDDELGRLLAEVRLHRDFEGQLLPKAHEIHRRFVARMPFIPLWRLDRHMVIATSVKVRLDGWTTETPAELLDPSRLFSGIALWDVR